MKNIHLIPTDKPSRLHLGDSGLVLCDLNFGRNTINGQNICITSDEEIKEGDWFIYKNEIIYRDKGKVDSMWVDAVKNGKKIILTDNKDLIKDGVQAIDDEFLQWFVKNPSCERVEVSYGLLKPFKSTENGYIIHLPDTDVLEEPKQETLEEVNTSSLENLLENNYDFNVQFHQLKRESIFSFAVAIYGESLSFKEWQEKHYGKYIEISKWQQEQNKNKYSEEDMIAFGWFCREKSLTIVELLIDKFKN
jgi:hypothetical protein